MKAIPTLIPLVMIASGSAEASYIDDQNELNLAVSQLRSAIGNGTQPRVYKMWIEPGQVTVDAQDSNNLGHINRWHFARFLGFIPWVFGPERVDDRFLDPNLPAMLFDLDAVTFSQMSKLEKSAMKRAAIADGVIKEIAIVRSVPILSKAVAGDVVVSLEIHGAREQAEVMANAQCVIQDGDFSDTVHAKTLNLFKEPDLIAEAAGSFRDRVGTDPVLTQVWVQARGVGFETNLTTEELKRQLGADATFAFEWGLDGLASHIRYTMDQRRGRPTQTPEKPSFNIGDVDCTIIAKLESDALAKVAIPNAQVTGLIVTKLNSGEQSAPAITWIVDVTAPDSSVTDVVADSKGEIQSVVSPSALPQVHR